MDTVTISRKQYDGLIEDQKTLRNLENSGLVLYKTVKHQKMYDCTGKLDDDDLDDAHEELPPP